MIKINSLERRPRILFDMDDVIVEFLGGLVENFNNVYGTDFNKSDCNVWSLEETLGEDVWSIMNKPGFFINLKPKGNSVEVIQRIIDNGFDVFIVTACTPQAYIEKLHWIEEYMPYFNKGRLIPCSEKSAVWGDILIDDKIANLDDFSKVGEGVIFDMVHNQGDYPYKRFSDLESFEDYINKFKKETLSYDIL